MKSSEFGINPRKGRHLPMALLFLTGLLLALSACGAFPQRASENGGDSGAFSGPDESGESLQESSREEGEEPETVREDEMIPAKGGELHLSMISQKAYNPLLVTDEDAAQTLQLIFSPLLDFDEEGRPQPSLAKEWTVSETNDAVTLTIDSEIRWQNGKPVTGEDVVFSIGVLNMIEKSAYKDCAEAIAGANVLEDGTVRIVFAEPSPLNLNFLHFPVISKDYYSDSLTNNLGHETEPMGSGPYRFASYEPMQSITLKASPDYFRGEPYIDTVVIHLSRSDAKRESFAAKITNLLYEKNANWGDYLSDERITLHSFGSDEAVMLVFNLLSQATGRTQTRQAIAYALDAGAILRSVNLDRGEVTEIPLPPNLWYAPTNPNRYGYSQQNVAKRLDLAGELSLRLLADRDDPVGRDTAEQVQESLGRQGIAAELDVKGEAEYREALQEGSFDIAVLTAEVRGERQLKSLLTGAAHSEDDADADTENETTEDDLALSNFAGYNSEKMQEILDGIGPLRSEEQIHQAFMNAGNLLEDDLPYYTLFFLRKATVTGPGVYGALSPTPYNVYRGIENLFTEYTVKPSGGDE